VSADSSGDSAQIGTEAALPHGRHVIAYASHMRSAQRTEDVRSCLSRRHARPASLSHAFYAAACRKEAIARS
jgi:hypothetical protein